MQKIEFFFVVVVVKYRIQRLILKAVISFFEFLILLIVKSKQVLHCDDKFIEIKYYLFGLIILFPETYTICT